MTIAVLEPARQLRREGGDRQVGDSPDAALAEVYEAPATFAATLLSL